MTAQPRMISVTFTQQQLQLLDKLKDEQRWGRTYEEIVLNVFRDYVKQEFGVKEAPGD